MEGTLFCPLSPRPCHLLEHLPSASRNLLPLKECFLEAAIFPHDSSPWLVVCWLVGKCPVTKLSQSAAKTRISWSTPLHCWLWSLFKEAKPRRGQRHFLSLVRVFTGIKERGETRDRGLQDCPSCPRGTNSGCPAHRGCLCFCGFHKTTHFSF